MTQDTTDDSDRQATRRGVIAGTASAAVATLTPTAAAQTSQGRADALFANDEASTALLSAAFVSGLVDGIQARLSSPEETKTLDDHLTAAVTEFQDHQRDWRQYANARDLGSADRQVLELTFKYRGEQATRYVIADYDEAAEEYASVSIVSQTDRTADASATLRDLAVENAAEELRMLHSEYIRPDEDIPRSEFSELAGQYYFGSDHITASFLGG